MTTTQNTDYLPIITLFSMKYWVQWTQKLLSRLVKFSKTALWLHFFIHQTISSKKSYTKSFFTSYCSNEGRKKEIEEKKEKEKLIRKNEERRQQGIKNNLEKKAFYIQLFVCSPCTPYFDNFPSFSHISAPSISFFFFTLFSKINYKYDEKTQ